MNIATKIKRDGWLPLLITSAVILLTYTLLAYTIFRFQINPDGISYINIAERYAAFDLESAINGYWGPLLSWVLVPFIWLHADPIISTYIIGIIASICLVLALHKFAIARLKSIKPLPLYLIETTLLLTLSSFALSALTPDILLALTLFVVFLAFVRFNNRPSLKSSVLLGLAGTLLYFAKPAGLLLFLFVFTVYSAYSLKQKAVDRKLLLLPLTVFLLLSLPYAAALSIKYGHLTFSTSSAYNLNFISPAKNRVHTITEPGIYLPAEHYNSVWDDPSNLPIKKWSPLSSVADLKHYTNEVLLNIHSLAVYATDLGLPFLFGLTSLVATVILVRKLRFEALVASTLAVGLFGLYALSVVEPRYLWPIIAFSFIGLLFMADHLGSKSAKHNQLNVFLAIAVMFMSLPLLLPINTGDVSPPYHRLAMALDKHLPEDSRIIADNADIMYVCYTLDIQCAGILPTETNQATIDFLRSNNVSYLKLEDPSGYEEILSSYYKTIDPDLHLYKLR